SWWWWRSRWRGRDRLLPLRPLRCRVADRVWQRRSPTPGGNDRHGGCGQLVARAAGRSRLGDVGHRSDHRNRVVAPRPSARPAFSGVLLLTAAGSAVLAATGLVLGPISLGDLSIDVGGPVLLASAIVLVVGSAASAAGIEWAALLAVLALVAAAPALRWSALAALVAVATVLERDAERPAWLAVGVVGLTPVLQALASPTWSARVQAVALGLGLVMMLFAARAGMLRVLVLPATTLLVMLFLPSLSPSNAVRFQWVAALGAALLIARPLLSTLTGESPKDAIRDRLLAGLLLLAIGARDSFGLGELAVI